jgi:hypothetical protein
MFMISNRLWAEEGREAVAVVDDGGLWWRSWSLRRVVWVLEVKCVRA